MLSKLIIRELMNKNGVGMVELAKRLGFSYPQKVTNRLYAGKGTSLNAETIDQMARALGYKVVVVPNDTVIADDWYEISDGATGTTEE